MDFEKNVKKVMPMFLLVMILNVAMIGVFNILGPTLATEFGMSSVTVSLMPMIAMLGVGIAGVVYAALSDYISMRKLMVVGIIMMDVGAILAFLLVNVNANFYLLLVAIAILSLGGSCSASLLIILVTRYLPANECPKYYGYSSACIGLGQALGFLVGGVVITYVDWRYVFVLPLLSIIAIHSIVKYIPDECHGKVKKVDILGLLLLTSFALSISLYFNMSDWRYLVGAIIVLVVFLIYISKGQNKIMSIDFFKNRGFLVVTLLAIVVFGIQLSFSFLMSFTIKAVYKITPDKISLILLPSYIVVIIVGANVGRIVNKLGTYKTMYTALGAIIVCMLGGSVLIDKNIFVAAIIACLVAGLYALPYTAFMQVVISTLKPEQMGTGVGVFTLIKGIGQSVMIVVTGKLISLQIMHLDLHLVAKNASVFSNIMIVFGIALMLALVVLSIQMKKGNVKINQNT
ncbi:tetracycline efflux MFS transporter Tet(38) [Clostridium sp. CTA-7]